MTATMTASMQDLGSLLVPQPLSGGSPAPPVPTVWGYLAACSLNKTVSSPTRSLVWSLTDWDYCDDPPGGAFSGTCGANLATMVSAVMDRIQQRGSPPNLAR